MVTAVITGASSGLGKRIHKRHHRAVSQCGRILAGGAAQSIEEIAKSIRTRPSPPSPGSLKEESIGMFEQLLRRTTRRSRCWSTTPGFGKCTDFFLLNRAFQTGMVDLNCRALTGITRLCRLICWTTASAEYFLHRSLCPHPQNVGLLCHKGLCSGTVKALHDELQPAASM